MNYRRLLPFGALGALLVTTVVMAHTRSSAAQNRTARSPSTVLEQYKQTEFMITMRDGVQLDTVVFEPRDQSRKYPILLERTPYSIPYVGQRLPDSIGPSRELMKSGYIFAYQDVRGTHMSGGTFVNVRPELRPGEKGIDESTDAYDTIDYLVKNVPNNNGRVGMTGISYPGFYANAGAVCGHPALVAVSPQAPVSDWFIGDDDHHNGAFLLMDNFDWDYAGGFDFPRAEQTRGNPQPRHDYPYENAYRFYLEMGPLSNANDRYLKNSIPYWNELMAHETYDAYWQERNLLTHLTNVGPAMLVTGGLFDAEDFYGTLGTFRMLSRPKPAPNSFLALGPWPHGGWADGPGAGYAGLKFGSATASDYRANIEFPFFEHYLKDAGREPAARAQVFDTGSNEWVRGPAWPPQTKPLPLFFGAEGTLTNEAPASGGGDTYVSDPADPVPYSARAKTQSDRYTPYMVEDQRFVDQRADVLTYRGNVLTAPLAAAGPVQVGLLVQTPATDADFVVKVIDIYPSTNPDNPALAGAEVLVRAEVMRGKFRDSYDHPTPIPPGKPTLVHFALPDICHTFLPGHRIAVQVQSSWFPLVDRNPQRFEDIRTAKAEDFRKAPITVLRGGAYASRVVLGVR